MTMPRWKREREVVSSVARDECDLVRRLAAGDVAALEELMGTYWRVLVLYAGRLLGGDVDAARDIAQEAFVRVWERRAGLEPGSVKSYLYRLTRNLALDEFRKRDVRNRWRAASESPEAWPPTPLQLVEREELGRAVDSAINALSPRRREAFTLAYLHRLSYSAVAEIMGVSPATVKNQLAAALAELRETLQTSR